MMSRRMDQEYGSFLDPTNPQDLAHRDTVHARIDARWEAFVSKRDDLDALFSGKVQWDLPGWMAQHLGAIDPALCWEFGGARNTEGHRLVITPESARHLRPLVDTVLERAPKFAGWGGSRRLRGAG